MKNVAPGGPHFGPASLDFHLNTPVISLIQLHIVPPLAPSAGILAIPLAPIWLVPEPPLRQTLEAYPGRTPALSSTPLPQLSNPRKHPAAT